LSYMWRRQDKFKAYRIVWIIGADRTGVIGFRKVASEFSHTNLSTAFP
jgi:hypothetical protein